MANDKLNKVVVKTLKSNVVLGTEESSSIGVNVPKLPSSETFQENGKEQYGIFAVNYAKGYETISTLNSANEVVAFNYNLLLEAEENIIDETIFNAVANAKNITINEQYTVTRKYCDEDKIVLCGIVPQIKQFIPAAIVEDVSQFDSVQTHLEDVFEAILIKSENTATFKIYEKDVVNDKEFKAVQEDVINHQDKIKALEEQIKDATGGSITTINGGDGISVNGSDNAKTIKLDIDLDIVTKNEDGVAKDFIRIIKKGDQTGNFIAEVDASSFVVDGMLKEATYDESTHLLHLTWNLGEGDDKTLDVNLEDLVNITYTAGDGLVLEDNKFSVKVDTTSADAETFLTVGEGGVKVSGVQDAINTAQTTATNEAVTTVKSYTVNDQAFNESGWTVKAEHIGMTPIDGVTSDNVRTALVSLKEAVDGGVNSITAGNGISVDTTNGTTKPTIKLHVAEGNEEYLSVDENGVKLTGINDIKETADNAKKQIDTFMLAADVQEDAVNTLKEIQDYISTHGEAAATMTTDIQYTKTRIAKVENDLGEPNGIATLDESGIVPTDQLPQLLELGDTEATAYAGNKGVELEKKLNELPNDVLFTYEIPYNNPIRNGFTNTEWSTSSEVYWGNDNYRELLGLVNKIKEFGDAGYKSGRIKLHFNDDTHNEYYYVDMPVYSEPNIVNDTLEDGTMSDLYFINAGGYKMKLVGNDSMFYDGKANQGEKWWEGYETVKGNQTGSLLQPGLMSGEDKAKLDNIDQYVTSISVDTNSDSELLRINYNTLNPSNKAEATPSITIPTATPSKNGCMSAEDKEKLNNHDIFYKQERVILTYVLPNTHFLKTAFENTTSNASEDYYSNTKDYENISKMMGQLKIVIGSSMTYFVGKVMLIFTTEGSGPDNTSYYYMDVTNYNEQGAVLTDPQLYLTNRGGYRQKLVYSDTMCWTTCAITTETTPYSIMSGFTSATQDSDGLMTAADKKKLDSMSTQNASTTSAGLMSADDKKKLDSLVDTLQVMTKEEYEALTEKDSNKVYLIKG